MDSPLTGSKQIKFYGQCEHCVAQW